MAVTHFLPQIDEDKVLRISVEHAKASSEHTAPSTHVQMASALGATAAVTTLYNTNGWDTVYVIPLPDVNAAIAAKKTSPTSWTGKVPAGDFNPEIDATGTFDTWSLATGGSGSIVRMHIPFTANLSYSGTTKAITGGIAYVEVKLVYIPQAPSDGTTPNNLKVRNSGGSADDPVVTVSSVTYTSPTPMTDSTVNVLEQLLAGWFNANLDTFQHVFATVNLGLDEASGDFAWLNPTQTNYAYIDNANIADALLGVLCMTENRSSEGAVQEIAAGAIPSGSRASFNMSLERFMSKMVLPSLPGEFTHAPSGTFVLGNNDTQIAATSSFDLDAVKVGAVNYTPTVTSYTMTVNGSTLESYSYIHTPISPGIDAYCEVTYYSTMALATKADGSQSLTWVQLKSPDEKTWYTVASWVTITEAVADIVLAVIGAVVSNVVSAVERVVVRVLIALLVGGVISAVAAVLEQVPNWIAGSVPDAIPSIDALVNGATKPQAWADSKDFKIGQVVLNGGLQLGGDPFSG